MERPAKRARLDGYSSDDSDEGSKTNGVLSINKEYASRFEHNKQREERQRLEEKFAEESEESSSDETEDDEADLITADLDDEIMTTLKAIKSKDPRVYDQDSKFYTAIEQAVGEEVTAKPKKDAPMTLKDYHRENILAGYTGGEDDSSAPAPTYQAEQDELRKNVIGQMHGMAEDESDDDGFQVKTNGAHEKVPAVKRPKITTADVAAADKDPETFLSNFMAAQAWRPTAGQSRTAFDSDDSEDEARADAFEEAYNMRFEDPATANEKLKSFARDSGQYTVRREGQNARQRARERERGVKEEAKRERLKDRERLKKLKVGEAEEKLKAIRQAAGMSGKDVDVQQWRDLLEGDFDDDAWDKEMQGRFGEQYYAEADGDMETSSSKAKPKKPTWNDDIDIADIDPTLQDGGNGGFVLSDDDVAEETEEAPKKAKTSKEEKNDAKLAHRRDKRLIEQMVEASLPVTTANQGAFRYRDTSPVSFGMRAQDILFASDAQLNQYAGLKKLAPFRDESRKVKDKKRLGKKARLREWRKEVFGKDEPPSGLPTEDDGKTTEKKSGSKRKRKSKQKTAA